MQIEAFSEGKDLDAPEANEDQFLVLPGTGYAVLDGVTDISGQLYDGMRAGRLASQVAAKAVAEVLLDPSQRASPPARLTEHVSAALRALYDRLGLLEVARADPARRFGATLALAVDLGPTFRFVLIGNSGLRINGGEAFINDTALDLVTASLRVQASRIVTEAGGSAADRTRVGRACAFHGATRLHPDMQPWLDDARRQQVYDRSLAWCAAHLSGIPEVDIRWLLDRGIGGQAQFQNNTISPLSYAVLDGFAIPPSLVQVLERPRAAIRSIELFTDGYFVPGAGTALADWEAGFAEVERVDPEKLGQNPSVKGSTARLRTDDRTVVIVRL